MKFSIIYQKHFWNCQVSLRPNKKWNISLIMFFKTFLKPTQKWKIENFLNFFFYFWNLPSEFLQLSCGLIKQKIVLNIGHTSPDHWLCQRTQLTLKALRNYCIVELWRHLAHLSSARCKIRKWMICAYNKAVIKMKIRPVQL